jgi:zinc/manganese transport system substrate-binding protein
MHNENDSHYRSLLRIATIAMLLGVIACSGTSTDSTATVEPKPVVVATTSIIGDVVQNLVGDQAELTTLIPPGVDPHDFALSSQQVASISEADLVIANGLNLEEGLIDLLTQVQSQGVSVLALADQLDPIPLAEGGEEHGGLDPHFWQDPLRMVNAVDLIATQLEALGLEDIPAVADSYKDQIEAANEAIEGILAAIPSERRLLVTNHDAFEYFASRYGFRIVGVLVPGGSTLAESSSGEIADLVDVINESQVPAIFVENIASRDLANTLAEEVGRPIAIVQLTSDALGEPGSETGTYVDMIVFNARAIAEALQGPNG